MKTLKLSVTGRLLSASLQRVGDDGMVPRGPLIW